ncbi:MAG: glycosyltransferase family 2 protein [Nanoarchaeota archaeon]|nr:glycosyltransferase family 2 protein [Nanoarchaeota archaeon]
MNKDVWVVVPAHNEEKGIKEVVLGIKKYCNNIVVVDDGSTDGTVEIIRQLNVIVLEHLVNMGKGSALKTGCDFAVSKGAKKIIVMDADGQHDPKEIPRFLEALKEKDVVFGYRSLNKNMPFIFRLGNSFINFIIYLLYGIKLRDSQCGYRAFTSEVYRKIRWQAMDYSLESEIIAKVGKKHLRYAQIPIQTIYADKYKGTTIVDGLKIVLRMFLWRIFK